MTDTHRNARLQRGRWVWSDSNEATVRVRSADPEVDFYPRDQTDQYIGIVSLTNPIAVQASGFAEVNHFGMIAWSKAKSGIETRLFATEHSWEVIRIDPQAQTVFGHDAFKDFRFAAKLFCHLCEIENQYRFEPSEEPEIKPQGYGTWS